MLEIVFGYGGMDKVADFTDYEIDRKERLLIVFKGKQEVATYNLDFVMYVKFINEKEEN